MNIRNLSFWICTFVSHSLCISVFGGQAANTEIFLQGRLTDVAGATIPGAQVSLRDPDGDLIESVFSGDYGTFSFRFRAGVYDLQFRLNGMIETWLKNLEIREQPSRPLLVAMPVLDGGGPRVFDNERAPAPPLAAAFLPEPSPRAGQPLQGKVIIQNRGSRPFALPTHPVPRQGQSGPDNLQLAISLFMPGSKAHYFRYYSCRPQTDCLQLNPGEMARFEVTLWKPERNLPGEPRPMIFQEPGVLALNINLTLGLPGSEARMTESVQESVKVVIER